MHKPWHYLETSGQLVDSAALTPEASGTQCIVGWVGLRAILDAGEKNNLTLRGNKIQSPSP
jgi:hypothetical protein